MGDRTPPPPVPPPSVRPDEVLETSGHQARTHLRDHSETETRFPVGVMLPARASRGKKEYPLLVPPAGASEYIRPARTPSPSRQGKRRAGNRENRHIKLTCARAAGLGGACRRFLAPPDVPLALSVLPLSSFFFCEHVFGTKGGYGIVDGAPHVGDSAAGMWWRDGAGERIRIIPAGGEGGGGVGSG